MIALKQCAVETAHCLSCRERSQAPRHAAWIVIWDVRHVDIGLMLLAKGLLHNSRLTTIGTLGWIWWHIAAWRTGARGFQGFVASETMSLTHLRPGGSACPEHRSNSLGRCGAHLLAHWWCRLRLEWKQRRRLAP